MWTRYLQRRHRSRLRKLSLRNAGLPPRWAYWLALTRPPY
jgi:hypothetical protein